MTSDSRRDEMELRNVMRGIVDSTLAAPEAEIDEELRALGEDPEEAAWRTRDVLLETLARHRRSRLERARQSYDARMAARRRREPRLPAPAEGRRILAALFAEQPRVGEMLTVQYRGLESRDLADMPDEDVLSFLRQLVELGVLDDFGEKP